VCQCINKVPRIDIKNQNNKQRTLSSPKLIIQEDKQPNALGHDQFETMTATQLPTNTHPDRTTNTEDIRIDGALDLCLSCLDDEGDSSDNFGKDLGLGAAPAPITVEKNINLAENAEKSAKLKDSTIEVVPVYQNVTSDDVSELPITARDSGLPSSVIITQSTVAVANNAEKKTLPNRKRDPASMSPPSSLLPPIKLMKISASDNGTQDTSLSSNKATINLADTPLSSASPSPCVSSDPQGDKVMAFTKGDTVTAICPENQNYDNASPAIKKDDYQVPDCDPEFRSRVNLDSVPDAAPLPRLTPREVAELELALQIGDQFDDTETNAWREDWNGNLQLIDKDITINRDKMAQNSQTKAIKITFEEWVADVSRDTDDFRGIRLLYSFVYHMTDTPPMARKIMAYVLQRTAPSIPARQEMILEASKRISYDPTILTQDGWTTAKADSPDGTSGGAYLIGRRVIRDRFEAIIIAYVRDEEIGDLWKALWLEDNETFDLEADELQEALKKWERKRAMKLKRSNSGPAERGPASVQVKGSKPNMSIRFEASRNFTVEGVEDGIILAMSYHGRPGIPWPARIMHVTEIKALGNPTTTRRSSSKNEIHVVFLAPYWNISQTAKPRTSTASISGAKEENQFSSGPLFELETIDVSRDTIQKYPHNCGDNKLSIDKIRAEFNFLGLPKGAFSRYLDSHRIAIALKAYAQKELKKNNHSLTGDASHAGAYASLTDTHPLSVRTPSFPSALLNLPFEYILSQFPHSAQEASLIYGGCMEEANEFIMDIHFMMRSLIPPYCWGRKAIEQYRKKDSSTPIPSTPHNVHALTPADSPTAANFSRVLPDETTSTNDTDVDTWNISNFASEYFIKHIGTIAESEADASALITLSTQLSSLITRLKNIVPKVGPSSNRDLEARRVRLRSFLISCFTMKGHGEDLLFTHKIPKGANQRNLMVEWRKACERVYKRAIVKLGNISTGSGVTAVITDSRCNQHLTAVGSFERAVRLPAAIRGAKNAGAGSKDSIPLVTKIEGKYMELAERVVMPMAHTREYLKRMREKIAALPPDAKGAPLTDDSEGEGGEDTMGSRGSYTAAVVGVAAALQGVDMVMGGHCVNAFCAVRPPGHHAGKELRAMNAISNGFCIFNAAACAALYATSSLLEGGLGLKRVCVIDFDVHHGNGTQDILCSTQDSRFLYISTHAGGAYINGYDDDDSDEGLHRGLNTSKNEGIFPGRCGDMSPHSGVLNIPLGRKVTSQAVGMALVSQVTPAVEAFSPELIIVSAGFDAHKNDPLGMGGLSAQDFGTMTTVICQMAMKTCSGRVLSILEGGYGVPCCRVRKDTFLPESVAPPQYKLMDLGSDLPDSMEDNLDPILRQKLDRCHQEGFLDCVEKHVGSLVEHSSMKPSNSGVYTS